MQKNVLLLRIGALKMRNLICPISNLLRKNIFAKANQSNQHSVLLKTRHRNLDAVSKLFITC